MDQTRHPLGQPTKPHSQSSAHYLSLIEITLIVVKNALGTHV